MAMAARRERGLYDPDTAPGQSPFDHMIYCFASDGDMEEGVASEASSLAGHQQLGNLALVYDDNHISIEDDTDIAFSDDVVGRYAAYGWHTQTVDFLRADGSYVEDVAAFERALLAAKAETSRPSFIKLRTIIAWPAPNAQNTGKAHGSALGAEEVARTKELLGYDPDRQFEVDPELLAHARAVRDRGAAAHRAWQTGFDAWAEANPGRKALLDRLSRRALPDGWTDLLPSFPADEKGMATRKASGTLLDAIVGTLPELWGGSADLAESNNTTPKGEPSFIPTEHQTKEFPGNEYGRTLHFGIREHGMGSILNGIALHGGTRPYGGTFLVFSDYMRPAVRLAALMKLPVTYVWTHDSIGLGEDGPTHQPIEHLAALRAIPGLDVVRPGDANETAAAWAAILEHTDRPAGLALTRQNVPTYPRGTDGFATTENVKKGGYTLLDTDGTPDVILIGTGSELQLAVEARNTLAAEGINARVVSMVSREWFDEQDDDYRNSVIPASVKARVSVEAGVGQGWREVVGDAGRIVSLEHFGASADYKVLFREFGITAEAVVQAAKDSIAEAAALGGAGVPAGRHAAGPVGPAD